MTKPADNICHICHKKVYVSKPISFGYEAIENTDPVEVRIFHFECEFGEEKNE